MGTEKFILLSAISFALGLALLYVDYRTSLKEGFSESYLWSRKGKILHKYTVIPALLLIGSAIACLVILLIFKILEKIL
jgi:hypothetical protein